MSDQKNDEDHMSLLDRPEVRQQRRRVTAGVATLDGMSDRFAQFMQRYNVHYGWAVAIATFLTMLATAGVLGSAGVMIEPLQAEFGWSNADISFALAVRLLLFGLMGPFSAAFMNRFGIRNVVIAALVLISSGLLGSFFMTQTWQLVLLWGVVVGFGTGMTVLVLGATVATRWFSKRRGLVVGLMTASNGTGQLVFLPLLAKLSGTVGWRAALGFVLFTLVLALVAVALLMRDHPDEVGLAPYGGTERVTAPPRQLGMRQLLLSPLVALREASKTAAFWALFFTFYVCGLSTNGLIQTHWIALCGDFGVVPVSAAGMLAIIGCFDFVGTILCGWLADRYDNRWLLFVFYGLRGVSLIYLPFSDFTLPSLSIFAVLYGLDWDATVPPTVKLAAERFGPEKASLIFGWIFAGHQLGAATAAFGAGATRTEFATYLPALDIAGAFCIAGRHQPSKDAKSPARRLRYSSARPLNTQALQKRKTYGDHLALLVAGAFCLVASLLVVTLSKATPKRTHKQLATSLSRSATNE